MKRQQKQGLTQRNERMSPEETAERENAFLRDSRREMSHEETAE